MTAADKAAAARRAARAASGDDAFEAGRGDRMLECFTLLGALAATTSTIELGVLVANVWNRQVGTLVSAAASVLALPHWQKAARAPRCLRGPGVWARRGSSQQP